MEGVGTFYYTCQARGNGVSTAEEVNATLINGVRVRFIPEARRKSGDSTMTRTLVSDNIFWEEWGGAGSPSPGEGSDEGEQDDHPLG